MDADVWREAKGVLAEALLCPPDERDAWVVERCTDPLLRREVQAYLHEYDEDFLESVLTVSKTIDLVTPSAAEEAPDVHPGEHIGPYVVLERLGIGGMGQVFLGNDTRLHRQVALKCLIASESGGDLRSRILHEARAAARINHPNIAIVHDVIDHDGRPFLVMEYVEGESLAAVLRRERPPMDRILAMGRQLASALVAAHAKGIIHRDLKPANIQVMPDGSVKILDFGVAQAMSMLVTETTARTTTDATPLSTNATVRGERGVVMHPGTPAYMSPEQMFGREIDQRSDIYSLGVVLYEMATGHRPYSAENPLDIVLALSRSLLRPTGAEANLSPEVSDVIGKMLAVKVEERYQTAAELETAIGGLIGPDPSVVQLSLLGSKRSRVRTAARVVGVVLLVPVVATLLGGITTAAFNVQLRRNAPFDAEPVTAWLVLGLRSLLVPSLFLVALLIVVWAVRFALRVLSLSKRVDHLLTTSRSQTRRLSSRLGLSHPAVIAQGVATVGVVALGGIVWGFRDVILAYATFLPIAPEIRDRVRPLLPNNTAKVEVYRLCLGVLIVFFSMATVRVLQIRRSYAAGRSAGALAVLSLLLLVAILMTEVPYRLVWQNKSERVTVADMRCYMIGRHEDDALVFCPEKAPPRNQVIQLGDPSVRRSGIVESIFTPLQTAP